MAKVIVERPRLSPNKKSRRYKPLRQKRKQWDFEEAPKHERMIRFSKLQNENLAPLERFLRKQVGRPWDKVYSELNKHVKMNNAVQAHIRQHLNDLIYTRIYRDKTGRIWVYKSEYVAQKLIEKGDLYVDLDGIIKIFK